MAFFIVKNFFDCVVFLYIGTKHFIPDTNFLVGLLSYVYNLKLFELAPFHYKLSLKLETVEMSSVSERLLK